MRKIMGWRMTSKSKQRSYMSLLIITLLIILVDGSGIYEVEAAVGNNSCMEEERMGLLEIKHSFGLYAGAAAVDLLLPNWDVDDHTGCCRWDRVECSPITGHVTGLSLGNIRKITDMEEDYYDSDYKMWPLNVSIFLHFPELQSLNLSWDFLNNGIENTGLGRLSKLRKLEILDLSGNYIDDNSIFDALGKLTSLKVLAIRSNLLGGYFEAHGFQMLSGLKKLENLNLAYNGFTKEIISSLSALPSLKVLNLEQNYIEGPFPPEDLDKLKSLEKLELGQSISYGQSRFYGGSRLYGPSNLQDCESLSRLNRLEYIGLSYNDFNESIISCLRALPSLKILDLTYSIQSGASFAAQDLSGLKTLEVLDLSYCFIRSLTFNDSRRPGNLSNLLHLDLSETFLSKDALRSLDAFPSLKFLSLQRNSIEGIITNEELPNLPALEVLLLNDNHLNGTIPMRGLASFRHLERLDLSGNNFNGNIPSTIHALSSLKELSLARNQFNGSLPVPGFCGLTNLQELDLSHNLFQGNLPLCLSKLTSLRFLDLSSNKFTGSLQSSLISSLTSLEYIDFSHNMFVGSFDFSSFSNHTKLEVVAFKSDNNNFEIETEGGLDWLPLFQLKVLVLSNCNLNRLSHKSIPGFLLHQFKLQVLDLSHNSLEGELPNWLIENNTMLEVFSLRNNSLGGILRMPPYRNFNTRWLDISDNQVTGSIPADIGQMLPYINSFNVSRNYLEGHIPLSVGDLTELGVLDLSNNNLSGEFPKGLFTTSPLLDILILSHNGLQGQVLSGNFNITSEILLLDNNRFTGKFTIENLYGIGMLDIENNLFSGVIPSWLTNMSSLDALVLRNNDFKGEFPCGRAPFSFLDISQNSFSGSLPACFNLRYMEHLHLDSNMFTGTIPQSFGNLSSLLTFDISSNDLSGRIPNFIGELTNLRVLFMRRNKFLGSIPDQICRLSNVSLIDLSNNYLSGAIPHCLQNITGPTRLAFMPIFTEDDFPVTSYTYQSVLGVNFRFEDSDDTYQMPDKAQFITKSRSETYKGTILDYMSGLDFSCNNLTGEIPQELGSLTHIHALNLSHNRLTGQIPRQLSNLAKIESLDLSWNSLSGGIPPELTALNTLEVFIVAHNNLSGQLPEMKGQFATFNQDSYVGNPLLCGQPLEKSCIHGGTSSSSPKSSDGGQDKWHDVDMVSFFAAFTATMFMFLFGFVSILYVNPYWCRRWFNFIDSCYYFLSDFHYNLSRLLSAVLRRNE